MNNLFDDIKNEYLNKEIPSDMNNNIDNLLNNLPKPNNSRSIKKYVKAASIVLIFSTTLFLLSLSYEPIRASLISLFNQLGISTIVTDNSDNYSEEYNEVIEVDNKYITINEVIYSPKDITFTYTLDPAFFGGNSNSNMVEKLLSINLANGLQANKISINNKTTTPVELSGTCKLSENGEKIIGYQNVVVDSINEGDIISIDINNLGLSSEKATLNFKVNMKMTSNDIFELKEPIVKQNENATISVEKLIRTPLITYVVYTLELKDNLINDYTLNADVVNEFGRNLYGNTGFDEKREFLSPTKVRIRRYLMNSAEGVDEINVIPFIRKNSKDTSKVFVDLNSSIPYTIDLAPFGTVKINSINNTTNKVSINCTITGINKDTLINNINIAPSSMQEKLQNPNVVLNFNPIWMDSESYGKFNNLNDIKETTISFDTTGLEEPLSIFYHKDLSQTDVLNDLSIKVKVK